MSTELNGRTLDMVAAEIRTFTASMLNNVIEIGRRMVEAKEMLPYGEFGAWIQENTGYSLSTAHNFMRIFTEYGAAQGCLFGAEAESQTFGKLSYTKALALLSLPAAEREEFVEEHDVETMSTRQLQQAIRERDAARQEAEGAALHIGELEQARDKAEEDLAPAKADAAALREKIKALERQAPPEPPEADPDAVEAAVDAALTAQAKENAARMEELQDKLKTAATKESALQTELDMARAYLKTARQQAKTARASGEAAAKADADAAKAEAAQAKREAERLQKQLAMSDPVTVEFKAHFATAQAEIAACRSALVNAPPELQEKFRAALAALGKTLTQ